WRWRPSARTTVWLRLIEECEPSPRGHQLAPSRMPIGSCTGGDVRVDLGTIRLMTHTDAVGPIAERIRSAFVAHDLAAFGMLLAEDVRWGDDDHPRKCRSRPDVLATFSTLMAQGVDAEVTEVTAGSAGVMCCLRVRWPNPEERRKGTTIY